MRIAALLVVFVLGGCATQPLGIIAKGDEVAVVSTPPTNERPPIGVTNAAIGQSATMGVGGGAIAGALYGLSCGPFAVLCAPVGAILGAAGGAIIGAGVGVAQGVSFDTRESLQRRMASFAASQSLDEALVQAIITRGNTHWVTAPGPDAPTVVRVRLEEITLYGDQGGRVGLFMRVVLLTRGARDAHRDEQEKSIKYVGATSDARLWIDDADGFVATSFRHACEGIAHDAFAYLAR